MIGLNRLLVRGRAPRSSVSTSWVLTVLILAIGIAGAAGAANAQAEAVWLPAGVPGSLSGYLNNVDCVSTSFCFAVGAKTIGEPHRRNNDGLLALRLDGTAWEPEEIAWQSEAGLGGISCVSEASCVAVGSTGSIGIPGSAISRVWNGQEWTAHSVQPANRFWHLRSISCVSTGYCVGVGTSTNNTVGTGALIEQWNGSRWTVMRQPRSFVPVTRRMTAYPIYALEGVSCVSTHDCVAVGNTAGQVLVEHWNGTSWVVQDTPKQRFAYGLTSVSCLSSDFCLAVGDSGLGERWNGHSWQLTPRAGSHQLGFGGVACTSTTSCFAVGALGLSRSRAIADEWDGKRWRMQSVRASVESGLGSVSCPTPYNCVAVGSQNEKPLIERLATYSTTGSESN
jgi:hypothetical protein